MPSWFRLYGEHVGLISGGVGLLCALLLLSLVFVGYDSQWLQSVESKEQHRNPLPHLHAFVSALQTETRLRTLSSPPATIASDILAAHNIVIQAYANYRKSILLTASPVGPGTNVDVSVVDSLLNAYIAANGTLTASTVLAAHSDLVSGAINLMYFVLRQPLTTRMKVVLDRLVVQQASWRMTALAAHGAQLHKTTLTGTGAAAEDLLPAGVAYFAANESLKWLPPGTTLPFPLSILPTLFATVFFTFEPVSPQVVTTVLTSTATTVFNTFQSAFWYLSAESSTPVNKLSAEVRDRIITIGFGAGLSLLALVICAVLVTRHIYRTRRARQLIRAFNDQENTKALVDTYQNVLRHMKIQELPPPSTDVEKEFHSAAKLVFQLRPLMSQALFGDLNSRHRRQPNGAWEIASQSVRLEMSSAFCHCTVLTVAISSQTLSQCAKDKVGTVLTEASMAFNAVVEEVNSSGGIVSGFGAGGRISCLWNATNIVEDSAFVAVKTARRIDKRLAALNIGRDLNIATGDCIVANSKVGSRKHVTFIGGAFDVAEKLLLLNEGHVARLIIDYDTYKELPREQQRTCKPIAVITDRDEPPIVVMSADDEASLKGEQWKQYNTAFTLYQNNMLSESLTEFRKYLQMHPGDDCAIWLIENVLEPKIGRRKSLNMR